MFQWLVRYCVNWFFIWALIIFLILFFDDICVPWSIFGYDRLSWKLGITNNSIMLALRQNLCLQYQPSANCIVMFQWLIRNTLLVLCSCEIIHTWHWNWTPFFIGEISDTWVYSVLFFAQVCVVFFSFVWWGKSREEVTTRDFECSSEASCLWTCWK